MNTMPNLFLKWRLFRELFDMPRSDREIAIAYWGPNEGPSRFSKMLRGDYGVSPDATAMMAEVINRRIATWRSGRGMVDSGDVAAVSPGDLELPTVQFVRRLLEAAGEIDDDTLDRAHRMAMSELAPRCEENGLFPRLVVERYSRRRVFAPFKGAGGPELIRFDPAEHLGQLKVELNPDLNRRPSHLYVLITRDASMAGQRLWDAPFSETVWWLPSPFAPRDTGGAHIELMPEPQPVMPLAGRYLASAILVFDADILPRLDPRGAAKQFTTQVPDEAATLRFLTNVSRVLARSSDAIAVASGQYEIRASPGNDAG